MTSVLHGNAGGDERRFDSSSCIPFWIDGKEVISTLQFEVFSPGDQRLLYRCSSATEQDVSNAISSAEKAFKSWSRTKPNVRRDIFLRAAEEMLRRRDELRHWTVSETGAPDSFFEFQYNAAYKACKSVAGLIQVATSSVMPVVDEEGSSAIISKEPLGVVLGISPWNAPYVLGLRACLQPLAMGNVVILKGAEASPATYWALSSILHVAGLPAGCLNTLYHRQSDAADITRALIAHPAIRKINFTGSTAVGSIVASLAGHYLKPAVLELGGKAPAIVCEDADILNAAQQCALGAFLHAGQICMSTERIIVHSQVADAFRTAFRVAIDQTFGGKEGTAAALQLVSGIPVEKNRKLLDDAVSKGAEIVYGDINGREASTSQKRPVVVEKVAPGMDLYYTESFGPTVSVYTVASDDEAIKLANDTEYGLSAAIFTEDLRRALRIARQLQSGAVHINSMTVHDDASLPHGGVKSSGFGRFNCVQGLDEWTQTKTITWKD
ncbi:vanillin dehydrogenase [Leptodontidium sp. MPI-SDFR-AT-0119]|nr:vanillin dehydrogenase [Leptodontidium sp. MPI-SDFR-AT-0119]